MKALNILTGLLLVSFVVVSLHAKAEKREESFTKRPCILWPRPC